MRSTATWRSMGRGGGPTSERKSGWCRAMFARRSTCTTTSRTAAAAEWKEAGRSRHVGKYARTDSARDLPAAACGPHYYCAPVARVTFDVFAETLSVLRSGDNRVCHVTGRGAGSGADATAPGPSDPG